MRWRRGRGAFLIVLAAAAAGCRSPLVEQSGASVGRGFHAWPVAEVAYEGEERRTDVLWPALSMRAAEEGGLHQLDVLWPLVHYRNDDEAMGCGLRPLVDFRQSRPDETGAFRCTELDVAWPFLYARWREDGEAFELRPFLWTGKEPGERHTVVFPFYWHRIDEDKAYSIHHLWPVYGVSHQGTERHDLFAFPLLRTAHDPVEKSWSWDVLWPLLHYGRGPEGTSVRVLPFFVQSFAEGSHVRIVFPFWWDLRDGDSSFRLLFPLYGTQKEGNAWERRIYAFPAFMTTENHEEGWRRQDVLWPLISREVRRDGWKFRVVPFLWWERFADRSISHLWPLLGVHRRRVPGGEQVSIHVAWPFARFDRLPDGWSLRLPWPIVQVKRTEATDRTVLFPLYGSEHTRKGVEGEESSAGSLLWPLITWSSRADGTREFRALWRLVYARDDGEMSIVAVNPLFHVETASNGDRSWSALFGMFGATRVGDRVERRVLWFLRF